MAGRALRAAHPQTEFTTTSAVPFCSLSLASTSADVRSSSTPRRVSSCRMGVTIRSSYIIGPSPYLSRASVRIAACGTTR